jgi:hypothetical protein
MRAVIYAPLFMSAYLAVCGISSSASAMPACTDFFYNNADASWSPTHLILMESATSQTQLFPSDKLRAGMPGLAGRIGAYLNKNCRNEAPSMRQAIPLKP